MAVACILKSRRVSDCIGSTWRVLFLCLSSCSAELGKHLSSIRQGAASPYQPTAGGKLQHCTQQA